MRTLAGQPYPLGATWDGLGVNFALFSEHATGVDLCLFDSPDATAESRRIALSEHTDQVWHVYLPDARLGQLYGYRVHGHYAPEAGHRFNPAKVLFDPYGKAVGRTVRWDDALFGYRVGDPALDLSLDERDSASFAPLAAVVDTAFTWGDDRPPRTPWHRTIIYGAHVKGFTMRHPYVPPALRGTYAGLASEAALKHLVDLGRRARGQRFRPGPGPPPARPPRAGRPHPAPRRGHGGAAASRRGQRPGPGLAPPRRLGRGARHRGLRAVSRSAAG